jgi:hypothetical protein
VFVADVETAKAAMELFDDPLVGGEYATFVPERFDLPFDESHVPMFSRTANTLT